MELKKSPKADLENKKNIIMLIGLVLSLGVVLSAFEYKTRAEEAASLGEVQVQQVEEEIIPITRMKEIQPPPPPPPPKVVEVLNIVDDDTEIEEELDLFEDDDFDEPIEIVDVVQSAPEEVVDNQVFVIAEHMPEFPGGTAAMMAYLAKNVKYPVVAVENGITGKVIVGFVVNTDGSIVDVKVLRGVDSSLDKAAVAVVKSMPKWSPGEQGGKKVRVSYNVPINFQLQ